MLRFHLHSTSMTWDLHAEKAERRDGTSKFSNTPSCLYRLSLALCRGHICMTPFAACNDDRQEFIEFADIDVDQ